MAQRAQPPLWRRLGCRSNDVCRLFSRSCGGRLRVGAIRRQAAAPLAGLCCARVMRGAERPSVFSLMGCLPRLLRPPHPRVWRPLNAVVHHGGKIYVGVMRLVSPSLLHGRHTPGDGPIPGPACGDVRTNGVAAVLGQYLRGCSGRLCRRLLPALMARVYAGLYRRSGFDASRGHHRLGL